MTVPVAHIRRRLDASIDQFMRDYVRDAEDLRIEVMSVGNDLRVGRANRIVVSARRARVGEFRRKPVSVELGGARVELHGVTFNPYALMKDGWFELLGLESVRIASLSVTEEVIRDYLRSDPKLKGIGLFLEDGAVRVTIRRGPIHASARLLARSSNGSLDKDIQETSLWGMRLPPGVVKAIIGGVDPEERLETLPVRIRIGELSVRPRQLAIGPDG